jgi:hypothetical protein
MPKLVTIGWVGTAPHIVEIYAYIPYFTLLYFTLPVFCFVTKPTDQTTEPIFMRSGSNNTVLSMEVPFRGLIK